MKTTTIQDRGFLQQTQRLLNSRNDERKRKACIVHDREIVFVTVLKVHLYIRIGR